MEIDYFKKLVYPSLYQINTRVWLTEMSQKLGKKATLDDISDNDIDILAEKGFDWIWLLSVWSTGKQGQLISREEAEWRRDFEATLPDLKEEDIKGSGFAIADYIVHPDLGGDAALKRIRERLKKRGLKLMLDFVPNHMGPDHAWVENHPEYFISGTETDLIKAPQNYRRIKNKNDDLIMAFGRDPYFSGWPDTVQLDFSNPDAVKAMSIELERISSQCDGVRCDMAMLILPEIYERTWGRCAQSFWPEIISKVHEQNQDFIFMGEVYWDMEWTLQQLGFNYTYDKRLYDRLEEGNSIAVREHFFAGLDYQNKMARFLENHDELRASSVFDFQKHKAVAIISFLSPGLRFFHQGQFEGRKKRISPHLVRAPFEPINEELNSFYSQLLKLLKRNIFREGIWRLLECTAAWDNNQTWESYLAFSWVDSNNQEVLVVVNFAPFQGQCIVQLHERSYNGQTVQFTDLMGKEVYSREVNDLLSNGMFIDLPPWGYNVFELENI